MVSSVLSEVYYSPSKPAGGFTDLLVATLV